MLAEGGTLYTANLRSARAIDTYTLKGDPGGEVWTPRFTFHGFRYVELSHHEQWLALLVFIGGLSAATGMVIVESIALSTMILNNLIVPWLVNASRANATSPSHCRRRRGRSTRQARA